MKRRIRQKWRPPLSLVIGGTLSAVLVLPVIAIGYFKVAGFILGWGETTLLIGTLAVVVTLLLAFLLWRLVLRPVYALTAHAKAVKDGRDDAPLPEHFGTPELTALGQAVLDMGSTLQDREAGLRAYTNHVTHELKSPLTSLIGATELLEEDMAQEDRAKLTETIRTSALKLQVLLDALRRLASARDPMGRGPTRLSQAIDVLDTSLSVELRHDREVPLDRHALQAILTHLAQNAAAHGARRLTVAGTASGFTVQDDGPGIAMGNRTRIFEPFFTTRRTQGGTGMGLAIVQTMLRAAKGDIALAPQQKGACFEITFE
ncbi:Sensor protein CreC [Roseovarius sp. THAF27]|uniref:sensor histidine kinase n=1 Tax=unclassified Roseovarius TaxID=2614913 RepID=UPI001268CDA8|nr:MULTISPECIES: ATP-binding protein [unclassified Roseovarius]QFT81837.1 Sensor protein CreC [Roseovarius sp. THAF27]QFT99025.1 Sensor protein CreC [Roseovarius sp. THAF8]